VKRPLFRLGDFRGTPHPSNQDISKGTVQPLKDVIKLFLSVATSCEGGRDEPENEAVLEARKHCARFAREYERHSGGHQPFRTSQKLRCLATLEARLENKYGSWKIPPFHWYYVQ
jgi:hypothetical protein